MDVLNLWNDDPEEVLLDLGFGCEESDLSGRVPARFINHQSQARGINLQVFLEAQKNRLDLENPNVSNRFRQLEVLQHVTTAFSSLVGPSCSPLRTPRNLPPEAWERRRRMSALLRRVSKKSHSQMHSCNNKDLPTTTVTSPPSSPPNSPQPPTSPGDEKEPLKRLKPQPQETVCLCPLVEEHGTCPEPHPQPNRAPFIIQEEALRTKEGHVMIANTFLQRKKSLVLARESFEVEEIHSSDDSSVTGSNTGGTESFGRGMLQTNSCQSDSSGFLEEPLLSLSQQQSPGPDLIKALSGLSGGSTNTQSTSSSLTSSTVKDSLHSTSCPPPKPLLVLSSPSPALPCHTKSSIGVESSEMETPPDQDLSPSNPPTSLPELACDDHPRFYFVKSQNITCSPSSPLLYPASPSMFFLHRTSSSVQPSSLLHLPILSHDSEDLTCSRFPSVSPPSLSPPALPPSSSLNLTCPNHASINKSSTQSNQTEMALRENPTIASGGSLLLLPFPSLPHTASPPSLASPSLAKSLSYGSGNCIFPSANRANLFNLPSDTQKQEVESPSSLFFSKEKHLSPSSLILNSNISDKACPTLPCLSSLSSPLHYTDSLTNPAVKRTSNLADQSISQQHRPHFHDNTDHATVSPVHKIIHVRMDHLSVDSVDSLQTNKRGDDKRHTDTIQIHGSGFYISGTENLAELSEGSGFVRDKGHCKTGACHQLPSCNVHDELSPEIKAEELIKGDINSIENEILYSSLVLHKLSDSDPTVLIEVESLDLVFETSVDGSEGEYGDVDAAFFQQLNTEGQVYWAEPILVSTPKPAIGESGNFEGSDRCPGNILLYRSPAALDSVSPTSINTSSSCVQAPFSSLSTTSSLKPSNYFASVQMSSSPSSHIVHRRDVPYVTDSKFTPPSSFFPLDTSSPFRAVQSWTDLQIQRNTFSKKLSHGALHMFPHKASASALEMIQRPPVILSSPQSCIQLSKHWKSHEHLPCLTKNRSTMSISVDTGLWPDEEEEVDRDGNEDKEKLWEANQTATMEDCWSSDHPCICCTTQHTLGNIFSLDELERMMLCVHHFRSVLSNIVEQLSEDRAAVYSGFSKQDRETVQDIEELRRAIKEEVRELEMHLTELAHNYDDTFKTKMHRLLDEQALLCSQLRVFTLSSSPNPNSTVAGQCCLQPCIPPADL